MCDKSAFRPTTCCPNPSCNYDFHDGKECRECGETCETCSRKNPSDYTPRKPDSKLDDHKRDVDFVWG